MIPQSREIKSNVYPAKSLTFIMYLIRDLENNSWVLLEVSNDFCIHETVNNKH